MKLGANSGQSLAIKIILILSVLASSCVQNGGLRSRSLSSTTSGNLQGGNASGNGVIPGLGATANGTTTGTTAVVTQRVELSHLIDPFEGTYKKKLTIPKNFKGNLYLAGLNVAALSSKLIKVRFNFGRERQAVTLNATLARAPGIVPNTAIQVLVIDMNKAPFANMRLGYDLYDYNDYNGNPTLDVVTDPRDGGLYCRGLLLEDDPTFLAGQGTTCNGATSAVCKYAYAKVTDATLQYPVSTGAGTVMYDKIPTLPLVWGANEAAPSASTSFMSNMCLPDLDLASFAAIVPTNPLPSGLNFNYPYRHINQAEWQISGQALHSANGLYLTATLGDRYQSLLFPRAGKLNLAANVNYYGSNTKFSARSQMISDATGTTQYVDGCNLRVMNYDSSTNESISSCNVSATIDVFYMNENNQEVLITSDKAIKLQLIRPSMTNYAGNEVLTSAFKSCTSSSTCGSNECCYNNRCWSKDLVTQCVDQLPIIGNQVIGANCSSDFECTSLCCDTSTGSCAPHNPNGTVPNFCSKAPGQQCVTKEFCRKDFVTTCKVTWTGTSRVNADGTTSPVCRRTCTPVETYGVCMGTGPSSACQPPPVPPVPTDAEVAACANAVDP